MSIEAMKQALEALENSVDLVVEDAYNAEQLYGNYPTRQGKVGGLKILAEAHKKAITALRQAIEQAQKQEPVAWMYQEYCEDAQFGWRDEIQFVQPPDDPNYFRYIAPVYTSPPQRTWVGLCEQERNDIEDACEMMIGKPAFDAIEAKLKEKNT